MKENPVLKSYKKKDVDEFLLALNAVHIRAIAEKDDEIKRLYSECAYCKDENAGKDAEMKRLQAEYEEEVTAFRNELESVNARLGAKLSAAEKAASSILADAETEKEKIIARAESEARAFVAKVKADSGEYAEKFKKLSDIFREHQQRALQNLDMMNKHLDTALEDAENVLNRRPL